jgi:hypothetical protein
MILMGGKRNICREACLSATLSVVNTERTGMELREEACCVLGCDNMV